MRSQDFTFLMGYHLQNICHSVASCTHTAELTCKTVLASKETFFANCQIMFGCFCRGSICMASHSNSALLPRRILNPLQLKDSTPLQLKDSTAMRPKDSTAGQLKDSREVTCLLKGIPTVSTLRNSTAVFNSKETNSTLVSVLIRKKKCENSNLRRLHSSPHQAYQLQDK